MRPWRAHRAVILLFFIGLLGVTTLAWGQFANQTGNVVGTVGGACNSSLNDYAWPDTNGNILKCVSSVWTLVTQPATAAGSTGYVQFNNAGALAGSANLFWDNTNNRLGIGTASPSLPLQVGSALTPVLAVTPTEASVYSTLTNTSGILPATAFITQATPASNSSADLYGTYTELSVPSSATVNYGNLFATRISMQYAGIGSAALRAIQTNVSDSAASGTVNTALSINGGVSNSGGGTITSATGTGTNITNSGTGTVTTGTGGNFAANNTSTGTIGTATGVFGKVANSNASGTVTTAYGGQFTVTNSGTMTSAAGIAIANISQATSNTGLLMGTTTIPSGNFGIYNSSTNPNYFAGNIGIGTNAPAYLLHVGSASASGIVEELQNSSGNCTFQPSSSALQVICSSDRRLKEDIDDAVPALPQLADMRVRNYTIKASGERTIGVIAQEMIWKHPDLVHMGPDGYYGVEAPNVWLLVKAIQELNAANDDLTARLSADDDALKSATDSIADLRESFEAYKSAHP
jgi:hypothetical protein